MLRLNMYIPAEVKYANRKRSSKFQNYHLLIRVTPEARLFLRGLRLAKESNMKNFPTRWYEIFIYFLKFYLFIFALVSFYSTLCYLNTSL